ncbi:MAG: hypothetical protein J6S05_04655 [Bacteroidaceae bacterium]|nr:hypothetical protein [Bacteroidaceae bacterium]
MRRNDLLPYLVSLVLTGGVCHTALSAQTDSTFNWSTLRDVRLDRNWLNSENPAGLHAFGQGTESEIVLYGKGGYGGLKNYFSSKNELAFGVEASSVARLSKLVVVDGKVGYRHTTAKALAASYFIDPTQTPFDLLEFTDENAGDKTLEELYLQGRVGVTPARCFSLGASMDYKAANYSKRKDLRHVNSLMDMRLVVGGMVHLGERVDIGLNYVYRRRNETLLLSIYGTQGKTFLSLLSYGAFFGKQETFGEIGYTKENENKPLFDSRHGANLQIAWRIGNVEWLNEVGFMLRSGYYGDPSHSTVVYSTHRGHGSFYHGLLTFASGSDAHRFGLRYGQEHVANTENIYSYKNEETGCDYIEYLGEREVGERTQRSLALEYTGRFGIRHGLARWEAWADASLDNRNTRASNYPDYRRQDISWWRLKAVGTRNFLSGINCYSLSVSASYGGGSGQPCMDGRYGSATSGEALTRTRNDLLMQEWEFLASTQLGAGIGFTYSRAMWKGKVRGNAGLAYDMCKALGTSHLDGTMRHTVSLRLGCNF